MWMIFVEMGVVVLIGVLIVWWTWPKKKNTGDPVPKKNTGDTDPKP